MIRLAAGDRSYRTFAPSSPQRPPASVVVVEPQCPVSPRPAKAGERSSTLPVQVRYYPRAEGAKLTDPQSLMIDLVINNRFYINSHRLFPMARGAEGSWEATIPLEASWSFLIFMVKDENDHIDNNGGNYFEILTCDAAGTPTSEATKYQAASYAGDLFAPGIQRATNYKRAISILDADIQRHPDNVAATITTWRYRIKDAGDTDAAYAKLAIEIEQFVDDHKDNERAITAAVRFVTEFKKRLPLSLFDRTQSALSALNPKSAVFGELMWGRIREETDPQQQVALYQDFIQKYPHHAYTQSAYAGLFYTEATKIKDISAVEKTFNEWRIFEPGVADVLAGMGRFYVEQKIKPERALELLTRAIDLCREEAKNPDLPPGIFRRLITNCERPDPANAAAGEAQLDRDFALIRYYRGQAQMQRGELVAAIEDLEFAARVLNQSSEVAFRLGEAYEKAGREEAAFKAYLEAATSPQQTSRDPMLALERIFLRWKMGTRTELKAQVFARIRERRAKVAADFKPVPLDRPAPTFEFTTLDGRKFNNAALKGRLVVLNFWADWCGSCLVEMPGFIELQRRRPDVAVISVAVMSDLTKLKAVIKEQKLNSLTIAPSDSTGANFGVTLVPQTYVLDAEGHIRFVHATALSDAVSMLEKELNLISGK